MDDSTKQHSIWVLTISIPRCGYTAQEPPDLIKQIGILPVAYAPGLKSAIKTTAPSWCFFVLETWPLQSTPQEGLWEIPCYGKKTENYCGETHVAMEEIQI